MIFFFRKQNSTFFKHILNYYCTFFHISINFYREKGNVNEKELHILNEYVKKKMSDIKFLYIYIYICDPDQSTKGLFKDINLKPHILSQLKWYF